VQPSTCRQATWKDSVDTRRAEAVFIRFLGTVNLPEVSQRFNLTQREREVLEYLLQGLDSKAIANRMNISPKHREDLSATDHDQDGSVLPPRRLWLKL